MCKTYNTVGSLTTLKSHLYKNNIYDFKSLKEVVDFQNSFATFRTQIITNHNNLIKQERNVLKDDLYQLGLSIEAQKLQSEQILTEELETLKQELNYEPKNFFQKVTKKFTVRLCKKKINYKEQNFEREVKKSTQFLEDAYEKKKKRYDFITSHFNDALKESCRIPLSELERKKAIIDGLNSFIYGAYGEQRVVKTLEELSDDHFLINDFTISFSPAIYNRQENDYIKSIQVDHILVAPSGIFLIETKNWSEKSLASLNLRSPVQQIKRTSFVLFKLLNNEINNYQLSLDRHHWGNKKIPIRNLIVLTNTKPKEEFQFVKILTVDELVRYVKYFKPVFSNAETKKIADFIIAVK